MAIPAGSSHYTLFLGSLLFSSKIFLLETNSIFRGLGCGISQSAVFISLQASISPQDRAIAASGLFLSFPVGSILGMAGSSAIIMAILKGVAQAKLKGLGLDAPAIQEVCHSSSQGL